MRAVDIPAGVRCYNGAFDGNGQAAIDSQNKAMAKLRKIEPEVHITLHHNPYMYSVHVWGRPIAQGSTRADAINAALDVYGIK